MSEKEHLAIDLPADWGDFLEWAASVDEGVISVGGLAVRSGLIKTSQEAEEDNLRGLVQLVESALREGAERTHIDVSKPEAVERPGASPTPSTVDQLSTRLNLPPRKLQELAGLIALRDSRLSRAAVRFAARSKPTAPLNPQEREAFEEFVKALAEATE